YQITATNGASSYNATGLPPGVTVNTSTGLVSGTPSSIGTFTATVSATNGAGTGSRTVTITITLGPPVITSATTAGGVVGVSFLYQITASNNPTTFGATGLPAGLSVNAANGVISGTPASSGTFNVAISATNTTGTANATLQIVVNDGTPIITSATTASAATGEPFSYRITAANNPTRFGARGLPPGLTINTATGLIAGTPTAAGQFTVEISATNATGTGGAVLRLAVTLSAPAGGNNQSASGQSGEQFRYQVLATNNPTSYSATGLPPGLQIDSSSGLIFGTPTNGGTFVARITATNAAGSVTFSVTITIGFAIARVADTTVNVAFQQTTAITLPITGDIGTVNIVSLPDHGIVATSAGSAMVSYTPADGYSGEDRFTYSVTNPAGTTTVATVSIVVGTFAPVGRTATMVVPLNTPTTIDLARFITASGLTGVSIAEDAKKGFVAVNGTKVTYTPSQDYFGPDSFTYVAFGNAGKSTPARVTVSIQGRPDPTRERDVTALVDAQAQAARRFSGAQIDNVHRRMETLHRTPPAVASAPRPAPRPAAADASQAPVPSSMPQLPTPAEPVRVASLMSPGMIASFVTSAATGSFDLQTSREAGGGDSFLGQTGFWIGGTAHFGSRTGGDEQGGYRFSTDGVSFGADRRLNDRLAVGVGLGFARDESRVAGGESRSKAKGASVALYASWVPTPGFFVDGLVGLGRLDFESSRYVASMDDFARGDRRGTQLFASVATGLERRFFDDALLVSPYARLDLTRDRLDAVTESGAEPYALRYGETRLDNSRVAGGLRIESRHTTEDGYVAPRARIEYRRDLEGTKSTRVGFADLFGEPEYTITPSGVSRNSLLFGIGADLVYRGGLRIGLDYSATRQDGLSNNQMVRLLVSQDLDARGGFGRTWGLMPRRPLVDPLSVEFSATYEDNVNRSREPSERLGDRIFTLSFGQEQIFKLPNPNTRVVVRP
ncbi:MAG TPA: autotransporter domain-containing protein, partial [Terriglobales bacterium]|nr:autotransporter domain-containing protein [Terriglobales bacterium]